MCEPTTLAVAGMAMTAISTGVGMYGQYEQQRQAEASAKASAEYNAQLAANDAANQQQLARNEIAKGVAERERQQRQAARAMGDMRAGMGASGFEMDSGSNLSLLAESAGEHQYDSSAIMSNAEQAAWQRQIGAVNALNDESLAKWQAANAGSGRNGAYLGMAGTLLGGLSKGIGQYDDWQRTVKTPSADKPKYWDRALGAYVSSPVRH